MLKYIYKHRYNCAEKNLSVLSAIKYINWVHFSINDTVTDVKYETAEYYWLNLGKLKMLKNA